MDSLFKPNPVRSPLKGWLKEKVFKMFVACPGSAINGRFSVGKGEKIGFIGAKLSHYVATGECKLSNQVPDDKASSEENDSIEGEDSLTEKWDPSSIQ